MAADTAWTTTDGIDYRMLVLLDDNLEAVGVAPKLTSHHQHTPLHLAFSCYAFDVEGRFLLTRRASVKAAGAGVWASSCCGHPAPGESLNDAVLRRLRAELGVSAVRLDVVLGAVRHQSAPDPGSVIENAVGPVVRALVSEQLRPNPEEVAAVRWIPWADLVASVDTSTAQISSWNTNTVKALDALGPDPWQWPIAASDDLPAPLRKAASARKNPSIGGGLDGHISHSDTSFH